MEKISKLLKQFVSNIKKNKVEEKVDFKVEEKTLIEKINDKSAKVLIFGAGYVGLPLAVEIAKSGFETIVYDIDKEKIENLKNGKTIVADVSEKDLLNKKLKFTWWLDEGIYCNFSTDIIIICVPTPLDKTKDPDVSCIMDAAEKIRGELNGTEQMIILESTVYPGFTRDCLMPEIGSYEGKYYVFSPERIDPGNEKFNVKNTPKIVGGTTEKATKIACLFYSKFLDKVVEVENAETAEMTKILENTFRMINIGLANEFALICNKLNLNVWEVIKAASTKPYGFVPFWPGPGVGGHCFRNNEWMYAKINDDIVVDTIENIYNCLKNDDKLKVLGYNEDGETIWDNVTFFGKRKFSGKMVDITTGYNYKLSTTDLHPYLMISKNDLIEIFAKDLRKGDKLIIPKDLPVESEELSVDIINYLSEEQINKIRVRIKEGTLNTYCNIIQKYYNGDRDRLSDSYFRGNYLPLKEYLKIEQHLNIERKDLLLTTGKGPSFNSIPAVINIDEDFCKIIGYYLSEGCITYDKSLRTRFTFGAHEEEYIDDLKTLLDNIGIKHSSYQQENSYHIKISSDIFGILIKDILKCGKDCYSKSIPKECFRLPVNCKMSLASRMIAGDGSVGLSEGKRQYKKNGNVYNHNNSATVTFFSCSERMTRQLGFLLQSCNIIPSFWSKKEQVGLGLSITMPKWLEKLYPYMPYRKGELIKKSLDNKIKIISSKVCDEYYNIYTLPIKHIEKRDVIDEIVYSIETENHKLTVGNGILVHNCISIDPHYLSWKLHTINYKAEFIDLATKINSNMPKYVFEIIRDALNEYKFSVKGSNILIVGVAYKPDINDVRESPALDIIGFLKNNGANVSYYDPYVDKIFIDGEYLYSKNIENCDKFHCSVVISGHKNINYKKICETSMIVVDTRNIVEIEERNIKDEGAKIIKL